MSVIDEYLKSFDEDSRQVLEKVRRVVKKTCPDAEEVITYGMPGFHYKGKYLVGFNAYKDHLSFFPTSEPIAVLKDQLKEYKTAKGTIQFTSEKPLSDDLIKEIVLTRMNSI